MNKSGANADAATTPEELDARLVALLNRRATASGASTGPRLAQLDLAPHSGLRARLRELNTGPLHDEAVFAIYSELLSALARETTVAFLGPLGSYSHQAALERFGRHAKCLPQLSIADVVATVDASRATVGMVPFENSTFGSVSQTLDALIRHDVCVIADSFLPIHHSLLSTTPDKSKIARVYSHAQALGQCQRFLAAQPGMEPVTVASTSHAAQLAAKEPIAGAICSAMCAELYGLKVVERNIEDMADNATRFFAISKAPLERARDATISEETSAACKAAYKTLVVFTVDHRKPGALCDCLDALRQRQVNITKIDSRPSLQRKWHYYFFVEMGGAAGDENVSEALAELEQRCLDFKNLGSYPCA